MGRVTSEEDEVEPERGRRRRVVANNASDAVVDVTQDAVPAPPRSGAGDERKEERGELEEDGEAEEDFRLISGLGRELFSPIEEDDGLGFDGLEESLLTVSVEANKSFTTSIRMKSIDASPLEKEIFKKHTRCFGLLFKTWRMERIFLDGHARLNKNLVYGGYVLLVVVANVLPIQVIVLLFSSSS